MVYKNLNQKVLKVLDLQLRRNMSSFCSGREVSVPVPWGEIRGREWGTEGGSPWLALHGWLDNANTFQPWAESHLPPGVHLLCLDYPGHGLSSHVPAGQPYHYLESLAHIKRVLRHQGWGKVGLMGHSMGAGMCMLYAATFPEEVSKLVMLDLVKPTSRYPEDLVNKTRQAVEDSLNIEEKLLHRREGKFSSLEEAQQRLLQGYAFLHGEGALTEQAAQTLIQRGAAPVGEEGGRCDFTYDLKHRQTSFYGFHPEYLKEFASKVSCPHLLIKAKKSMQYDREELDESILNVYRKNPHFIYEEVEGNHHVHLNVPEVLAAILEQFITTKKSSS